MTKHSSHSSAHFPLSHVTAVHHPKPMVRTGASHLTAGPIEEVVHGILEKMPDVVQVQIIYKDRSVSTFERKDV